MQKKHHGGRRRYLNNRQYNNRNRHQNRHNNGNNNIANRVMDSNGPAGRIKGTAQQLVDKYNALADEQTGPNADTVLREKLLQFAEHYQRILVEAGLAREQRTPDQNTDSETPTETESDTETATDTGADTTDTTDTTPTPKNDDVDDGVLRTLGLGGGDVVDLSTTAQPTLDLSQDDAVRANMEESPKLAASKNAQRIVEGEETPKPRKVRKTKSTKTTTAKRKGRPKKSAE